MSSTVASEAGHWYAPDGTPAYEIMGKNGRMRNTTIKDARVLGYVPSVTTIIRSAAAPALEIWKINQHLTQAYKEPMYEGEDIESFLARIRNVTRKELARAPDLGSDIHGDIEKALTDTIWIPSPEASAAIRTLGAWCGHDGYYCERSFHHPLGFGGKCDIHKTGFVADFKTKNFGDDDELPTTYENHSMQLAAYREGFKMPSARCAIIYVSTRIPGLTHLVEVGQDELDRGWEMFKLLLEFWKLKNRFDPRKEPDDGKRERTQPVQ